MFYENYLLCNWLRFSSKFRTKIIPDGKKTPISDLISIAMCYIFIGCLIILPWAL